jgi:hypothetical protein
MQRLALVLIFSVASVRLYADSKKLTEDQRIEILRGLSSEYAKIKVPLPRTKSALEVTTSGTRDEAKWKAAEKEYGAAGRVGDLIQVTRVDIGKDRIVLDLNGGIKGGRRFMDHVQVGMGTQTRPVNGDPTNAAAGTAVALIFDGPIGEVTSAEIKKMLQPILDFEKESVTANYVDTLPEPVKEAVRAKKVIEGMNHDQVLLAVGKPVRKSRETKAGTDYEDWIYGEPPGRMTFVTFTGDKVVKVKETYAGLGGSVAETPQQP